MTILLTREEKEVIELKSVLQSYGHEIFCCQTIELKELRLDPCGTRSVRKIAGDAPVLITSKFACQIWLDLRETFFCDSKPSYYAVVGETSANMLREADPNVPIKYQVDYSKNLLNCDFSDTDKILYPCSKIKRQEVFDIMQHKGVRVIDLVLYDNLAPKNMTENLFCILSNNKIDAVVFFSPSAVKNYFGAIRQFDFNQDSNIINSLKPDLKGIQNRNMKFIAIGETTKLEIQKYYSGKIIMPARPNISLLAEEIKLQIQNNFK